MAVHAQNYGATTFLLDWMASHGNSGSPVFALSTGGFKLAGMVSAHKPNLIQLFDESHQTRAALPYNSGLAIAVRASQSVF
jgi:hypothetical protein